MTKFNEKAMKVQVYVYYTWTQKIMCTPNNTFYVDVVFCMNFQMASQLLTGDKIHRLSLYTL